MIHMHIDQVFFCFLDIFPTIKSDFFFLSEKYYFDWSLFIAVKKDKNKDYNICISQSHLLHKTWRILTEKTRWLWNSSRILHEFLCHMLLWQNYWPEKLINTKENLLHFFHFILLFFSFNSTYVWSFKCLNLISK